MKVPAVMKKRRKKKMWAHEGPLKKRIAMFS
jgi:hypothetical protein